MVYTLAEKTLIDGTTLKLRRHQLDETAAEAFHRPVGSDEIVLDLFVPPGHGGSTQPHASWHLSEEDFRRLYNAVRNQDDFRSVVHFLEWVATFPWNVQEIDPFLEKLYSSRCTFDYANVSQNQASPLTDPEGF